MKDVTHNTNNTLSPKYNPRASGFTILRRILNKKGHRQFHTKILPKTGTLELIYICGQDQNQYLLTFEGLNTMAREKKI